MTIRTIVLSGLLLAATIGRAEDQPKPNTLNPREVAEGWLLLFDGETAFGWKTEGEVKIDHGTIVLGRGKAGRVINTTSFAESRISVEVDWDGKGEWESFNGTLGTGEMHWTGTLKHVDELTSILGRTPGRPLSFAIEEGKDIRLRNLKLLATGGTPLFNGQDLAGWTQYTADPKRAKSKFTVTPDGWLNVKDGPGDLQTEKLFDDFVLQAECISHGKHFNSGIFFRCLPGEYQQGYEAQIQNGYKDGDRTKPVDYGTGAIYRRVPARKVVSNDNEWFTMTVVAQRNHISTWVNGYQVVDFTDERKPNENARNGSKTGKGAISIQGHDPTTNLSFRNIRIAELQKK
jgi:hypothetical protein